MTMPQFETIVPLAVNLIGVVLIVLWVAFIGILLVNGAMQFAAIMLLVSLMAVVIVAANER